VKYCFIATHVPVNLSRCEEKKRTALMTKHPSTRRNLADLFTPSNSLGSRKHPIFIRVFVAIFLTTEIAFVAAQEPQKPDLRLRSDLVEIRAVVTDKLGKAIRNLRKEDFEVIENGKPQEISFFAAESLAEESKLGAAAAAKEPRVSAREPKRTMVFFVDTLHISNANLLRLQTVLLNFINNQVTDQDLAAVVTSSGSLGIFSQFTKDKQVLRKAVSRLAASAESRPRTLYTPYLASKVEAEAANANAIPYALEAAMHIVTIEEQLPDDPHFRDVIKSIALSRAREIMAESTFKRRATMLTLRAIAERLSELPGQRLLLMLSDGFTLLDGDGVTDYSDLQSAISRAVCSGVVVNTIGTKGLNPTSIYDVSGGRFTPDLSGLSPTTSSVSTLLNFLTAGDRELENGLTRLAKDSGGVALLTTNDLSGALRKAVEDNANYYALSYYLFDSTSKDNLRRIKVRVKGHPEYEVRAQTSYLATAVKREAPSDVLDPQKQLLRAINSPLVSTGIGVDAVADFLDLASDKAQISLAVYTDGRKLKYLEDNKSFTSNLVLMTEIIDARGQAGKILMDTIQIRLTAEQYQQSGQNIYRYTQRLALQPGLYQVRVGVRDPNNELYGTASTWVEVPKLSSGKLFLSSLSVGRSATLKGEAQADWSKKTSLPVVRNGVSIFRNSDSLAYFCRAYNAATEKNETADLVVQTQIFQNETLLGEAPAPPLTSLIIGNEGNAIEFGNQLNLANLKPGIYEFRITLANQKTGYRATMNKLFEIEP
jgi:VWFA-related protein